ncbi:MAG: alpha/beta hydrolase-fold protein [Planctomycetaceae bacterium]
MNFLQISVLAFLMIPGVHPVSADEAPGDVAWVTREVRAPRVSFHTFDSAAAKSKVSYHLYLPAAYEREPERRFPVVYWLHGSGGGLAGIAQVARSFDAAIESGKTPACLVVFVNGLVEGMYVDWKDGSVPLESVIIRELLPHIDKTYRTVPQREGRALDGYSMGGYGAARLGFSYPQLFRGVSIMGGGPLQAELIQAPRAGRQRAAELLQRVYGGDQEYFRSVSPRRIAERNAEQLKSGLVIRQVCGDRDETFGVNRQFHEHLEGLGIPHTWQVLSGVEHNPLATIEKLGDSNWPFYREVFESSTANVATAEADFELTLQVGQRQRRAVVVNAAMDGSRRPAVLVLHGGVGNAAVMRANSGFDRVARAEGFMVVYAEGTAFAGDERCAWNTGHLLRRQVRDSDDIAYFDALIDRLTQSHGADAERIYMTGGSNGGMMTFVYGVARAERLAAIAPVVAAMFTFDTEPAVPLPILLINGGRDGEVPLEGGMSRNVLVSRAQQTPFRPHAETVPFWVRVNRSETEGRVTQAGSVTTTVYAATEGGAVTEVVVDSEGGHGWPGSRARRAENAPISAFSGAERVWEFFRDKRRGGRGLPN